ncbi:polyamine aminopropyltransferase [Cetobacterium ceti]
MTNLWFTEKWSKDTRFSIKVKTHLYSEKTPFQQIDFFNSEEYGNFFTLDGFIMVTEKDEFIYHDMITHVPMGTNPKIKKVLVIGAGDGGTVRELTKYNHIEKIDMVEIDERVVLLCEKYLPITSCKLRDKRVNLYFQDGLQFVKDSKEIYDLIIVDSTDPISVGEGLFTENFYKNCFRILSEEGILVNQHESPFYENFKVEMVKAHQKLKNIFPIATVYQIHQPTYASGHWMLGFASKKYDPILNHNPKQWESLNIKTKYYNSNIHKGAFALPNYVLDILNK